MLDKDVFLSVVKHTPLVAIDLITQSTGQQIMMGKRSKQPAGGFWFVPGGRTFKGESLPEAFHRMTASELGAPYRLEECRLPGAFIHRNDDLRAAHINSSAYFPYLIER